MSPILYGIKAVVLRLQHRYPRLQPTVIAAAAAPQQLPKHLLVLAAQLLLVNPMLLGVLWLLHRKHPP
jgi:hypothetical protein